MADINPNNSTYSYDYLMQLMDESDEYFASNLSIDTKKSNKNVKKSDSKSLREEYKRELEEAKRIQEQEEQARLEVRLKREEEKRLQERLAKEEKELQKKLADEAKRIQEQDEQARLEEELKRKEEERLQAKQAKEDKELQKRLAKEAKRVQKEIEEAEEQRLLKEYEEAQRKKREEDKKAKLALKEEQLRIKQEADEQKKADKQKVIAARKAKKEEDKLLKAAKKNAYKIVDSKSSSYKKPKKIKNLTCYICAGLITILSLGFVIHSGVIGEIVDDTKQIVSDIEDYQLQQKAKKLASDIKDTITNGPAQPSLVPTGWPDVIIDDDEEVSEPTPTEEVPQIPTELIDTSYYENPDIKFNDEITPEYLKNLNPSGSDNVIWLSVPGTKIDYPVVLPSTNNIDKKLQKEIDKSGMSARGYLDEYFLHKNLSGSDSKKGTLYIDIRNAGLNNHFDEISDHTVIYGHNMKDGSMFHSLANWKNDVNGEYNSKHSYGIIYTDDGYGYIIKFIASRVIDGDKAYLLYPGNFNSPRDKRQYVKEIYDAAKENGWFAVDDYEVDDDDKLVSLVTCAYDHDNVRMQLIGEIEGKVKVSDLTSDKFEDGYNYVEENATLHR